MQQTMEDWDWQKVSETLNLIEDGHLSIFEKDRRAEIAVNDVPRFMRDLSID